MSRGTGIPGQNVDVNVADNGNKAQVVCQLWPKTWYGWTDRTGIATADVSGVLSSSSLTPISTSDAGTLLITADGNVGSTTIGITVVLWDERGFVIGGGTSAITLSGWLTNASGNFVAFNGFAASPSGCLQVDVSNAAGFNILVQSLPTSTIINLHWKLF